MTRTLLSLVLVLCTLLSSAGVPLTAFAAPSPAAPAAAPGALLGAPAEQEGLAFYPETGYRIANPQFADFFSKRGGLRTFGYPVSRGFLFLGTQVQFFQRQIMQIRPDGNVGTLNILDEDLMPYTRINGSVFPAVSAQVLAGVPDATAPNFGTRVAEFVTSNAPDTWNNLPVAFNRTFNNTVRYEEAFPTREQPPTLMPGINLELWGVPTSQPAYDPTNAGFVYLRFQRGIMHFDASTNITQGLLLADYLKAILTGENLPADLETDARSSRFYRQYSPGQPLGLARPSVLVGTDLTGAFAQEGIPVTPPGRKLPPPYDSSRLGYGMGAHLWYQDQGRVTRLVKETNFGWIKQQVRWSDVERSKGQIDWAELDKMVDSSLSAPLNILFSVVSSPTWSRADGRTDGPPDNLADFGAFMGQIAGRYQGQVRAYEVWNEQNFSREWGGGRINAGEYVELLKVGYTAVKAADANAIVLVGALTPNGFNDPAIAIDDLLYFEQMYQYQGGIIRQFSDAVGAHAGGYNNPPETDPNTTSTQRFRGHPSFYFRRIEQLRAVMERNGDGNKKMWLTEFGWSTANRAPGYEYGNDNTEADQANYLVRAFDLAKARYPWMGVMFVWNLNFGTLPDLPATDEKPPFGILNRDFTPRPAYTALQRMAK
ncbi:MAG: hypothetical protein M3442_21920 [Chloroflexota bacterium]|nr:hypothetical protein [Chloroflexota bacterium]